MLNSPLALKDLVLLDQQLRRDRELPLRQLHERDRAIGAPLQTAPARRKLQAWLRATSPEDDPHSLRGFEFSVSFWLSLVGLLAGLVGMGGLLLVDRQEPVNVLLFLALFVGTQWLFLLLTLAVSLALALRGQLHLPLEGLNPARWLFHRTFDRLAGELRRDQLAPVVRMGLLRWGQVFGVFFNLGLLAAMLIILLVVDRSFGWSSTLDISVAGLQAVLQWLAAPWAWFLPEATVDAELIAATRYQSLQTEFNSEQLVAMRAWWPFLFISILFYGLLPRLILWLVFHCLYRRQLLHTFLRYPGAGMVLDRMNSPLVDTRADSREAGRETDAGAMTVGALPQDRNKILVNWAGALDSDTQGTLARVGLPDEGLEPAGLNLAEDQALLRKMNEQKPKHQAVVILVKSWEPPLGELGDFLRGISPKLDCYLLLLPLRNRPISSEEFADWQRFARQQHHPRLVLVAGGSQTPETKP